MKRNTATIEVIRHKETATEEATYSYTLLLKEVKRHFARPLPRYSVRIKMIARDGRISTAESGYIFVDPGKAIVFYEKLSEHLCTPLNLPYVLDDSITIN